MRRPLCLALLVTSLAVSVHGMDQSKRVVIYDEVATEVNAPVIAPMNVKATAGPTSDLWITTSDLTRATRFVIKPQGVCRDELCFPLPKTRKADFISRRGSVTWFNLSEFARLIKQPSAFDLKNEVWYFGARTAEQNGYLASLEAPDFTLPDLNGKLHSLRDFRGKKVLLVTWASW
jgi:AhpC/TSA family